MADDVYPPASGPAPSPEPVTASILEENPPAERTPVAGVQEALRRRWARPGGRLYAGLRWGGATVFAAVALVVSLVSSPSQAFAHSGLSLLWTGTWDPTRRIFGAETFIVGTLVTTAVALVLAVPVGVATASFLSELAPRWLATPLSVLVSLIAAVPSIVVGLWGLLVLTPVFTHQVEPFFKKVPVLEWFFHGARPRPERAAGRGGIGRDDPAQRWWPCRAQP